MRPKILAAQTKNVISLLAMTFFCSISSASDALEERLEELEKMMEKSGMALPSFSSLKLISKTPSPIPGLDALVYDAMVDQKGRSVPQRIVFFADKERRYMVMGSIVDMKEKRDVGEDMIRKALSSDLSLGSLQRIPLLPGENKRTVSLVLDLGQKGSREFLTDLMDYRSKFNSTVELSLVSNAQDEASVGGQAIIAGSQSTPFFYEALSQWLKADKKAAFMSKDRLRKDPQVQARMGRGIFHIENNTTALLRASANRLPIIFVTENGVTRIAKVPASMQEWCDAFACK